MKVRLKVVCRGDDFHTSGARGIAADGRDARSGDTKHFCITT